MLPYPQGHIEKRHRKNTNKLELQQIYRAFLCLYLSSNHSSRNFITAFFLAYPNFIWFCRMHIVISNAILEVKKKTTLYKTRGILQNEVSFNCIYS